MTSREKISLAHGNGGRRMRELIHNVIATSLDGLLLDIQNDAAHLPIEGNGQLFMTTDGFTVSPLEFPGGDIGSLAIHGTVNDLAVSGAVPLYLSLNLFIEEGTSFVLLQKILHSMRAAALDAGIQIACGDTKVVPRGDCNGLFIATCGIGRKDSSICLGMDQIHSGDAILVSGPVGDHGIAVLLAREQFGIRCDVQSDAANVMPLTQALLSLPGLAFMRDPTRGGFATVLHEIQYFTKLGCRVRASQIPIREAVQGVCELLGYDPLYLACEGRVVAIVHQQDAAEALARWRALPQGASAAIVGEITSVGTAVTLETELGGERVLEDLEEDALPRIC